MEYFTSNFQGFTHTVLLKCLQKRIFHGLFYIYLPFGCKLKCFCTIFLFQWTGCTSYKAINKRHALHNPLTSLYVLEKYHGDFILENIFQYTYRSIQQYQHQIKNFYTNKEQNICVPMFYIDFYCDNLKQSNFKDKM